MITNELLLVNNIFLYKFASWCFQGDVCKLSAEFSWISCSETWLCLAEEGPLLPWKSAYLSSEKTTRQRFSVWLQPNFIKVRSKTSMVILGSIIIIVIIITITIIMMMIWYDILIFLGQICPSGERCNEVNPMWSSNPWNKARPLHGELHVLLFTTSAWVL